MHAVSPFNLDHLIAVLAEGAADRHCFDELLPHHFADTFGRLRELEQASLYCGASVWTRLPLNPHYPRAITAWNGHVDMMNNEPVAQINSWVRRATDGMINTVVRDVADIDVVAATALALRARWGRDMCQAKLNWDGEQITSVRGGGRFFVGGQPGEWCVQVPFQDRGLYARLRMNRADHGETQQLVDLNFPAFHVQQTQPIADVIPTTVMDMPYTRIIADAQPIRAIGGAHSVVIDCDHHGVAAAAVSLMAMAGSAAPRETPIPVVIDEPFLFEIWHHDTLLFEAWIDEIIPAQATHSTPVTRTKNVVKQLFNRHNG